MRISNFSPPSVNVITAVTESEFLTALHVNEDLSQLKSEIRYFQTNTIDYVDDSQLTSLCQKLQDAVKEVSTHLAAKQKKSFATEKPPNQSKLGRKLSVPPNSFWNSPHFTGIQWTGQTSMRYSQPPWTSAESALWMLRSAVCFSKPCRPKNPDEL